MRKEFFNAKNRKLDSYMVNCGYEDCVPGFVCHPHIRKYYLVHYVTAGEGYYEVRGIRHPVRAGDVFVIYPGDVVSYAAPDKEKPWSFCWMGFSGNGARRLAEAAGLDYYTRTLSDEDFYFSVKSCLDYITHVTKKRGVISQLRLCACVMSCLHALENERRSNYDFAEEYVGRAIRYIEYNVMTDITVHDVADHLMLDRTYFYRMFRKIRGISPKRYIMDYRIKRAKELLATTEYSVTEVALFVGVRDVFYFSRLFKRLTGISPTNYRQSLCDGDGTVDRASFNASDEEGTAP